jgi:hypothetical protein
VTQAPSPGHLALAKAMSEDTLQSRVLDFTRGWGVWCDHNYDSRRGASGWPDLVLIGPHGVIYRELKTQGGRIRPEQHAIMDALIASGADVDVWRPLDLVVGRIRDEIMRLGCWPVGATLRPIPPDPVARGTGRQPRRSPARASAPGVRR